jgi:multidrug efflux pump subunit AcrA (membrane-fusion protein)
MAGIPRKLMFWSLAVVLLLATVGVGGIFLQARRAQHLPDPAYQRRKGEPIPVRTALVTDTESDQVIGATCLTAPSSTAAIRLGQLRGFSVLNPVGLPIVKKLHAKEGDPLKQGDIILEMEDRGFQETMAQRKVALTAAQASLDRVIEQNKYNQEHRRLTVVSAKANVTYRKENLDLMKKELDAIRDLQKKQAATLFDLYAAMTAALSAAFAEPEAERALQKAEDDFKVGPYQDDESLKIAKNNLELAKLDLEVSQNDIEQLKLRSPIDGFMDYGQLDEPVPGLVLVLNNTIGQVVKLDPIDVRVDFPQERIDDVFIGQKADVTLDSFPKETFKGTVAHIWPQVNSNMRILTVEVKVPNPNNRIKSGISGFTRLHVQKKGLTVPATAVLHEGTKTVVFRIENGRARSREVRVGSLLELGMIEVLDGLQKGDEVVVYHNFYGQVGILDRADAYLQDNDRVDTNWRKWARRD